MIRLLLLIVLVTAVADAKAYKGAEYRTKQAFTYGRFEVRMKSAHREGMLSSFFTYHEITSTADWNEIDIEILGRYDDDIQFNPITPGQVNHVGRYKAPFNPAHDFHIYAFEWTPLSVAWFVDGTEVHRQTGAHIEALNLPQKIMMNVWNPTYSGWVGEWNDAVLPAFAYYDYVKYYAWTPDSGNAGTGNDFTLLWSDEFSSWDQSRWEKGTHTWNGNGCDFVAENAVFRDGMLVLCLTKETPLGYTDNAGPAIITARAERDGIRILFTEELDSASAVKTSNYTIVGKTVSSASLLSDRKTVFLTVDGYDTATVSSMIVMNIKDRFVPANTAPARNVTLTKVKPLTMPVKINIAGPAYKDYLPDKAWTHTGEYGYLDGTLYTNTATITGTLDPVVFNSELAGAVKYQVRVPNGKYMVVLMMAESYFGQAGKRVFSVAVQDSIVEKDLDLFAKAGKSKVYQRVVQNVSVTEGLLEVHLLPSVDNAVLNGIQIVPLQSSVGDAVPTVPSEIELGQNFPNPFNGSTVIPFSVSKRRELTLRFFDTLGRTVAVHAFGPVSPGDYTYRWTPSLSSGVYFYAVDGASDRTRKKLLLIQ